MIGRCVGLSVVAAFAVGCTQDHEFIDLVGGEGVLRFNLQFTNELNVDLDLHVLTPTGEEIYYAQAEDSSGGSLDVDCFCDNCESGPNENIFWPHSAFPPAGTYTVWIEYYAMCTLDGPSASDYTLRILEDNEIAATYTGTMDAFDLEFPSWTHVADGPAAE